jgi:hypothetical protein
MGTPATPCPFTRKCPYTVSSLFWRGEGLLTLALTCTFCVPPPEGVVGVLVLVAVGIVVGVAVGVRVGVVVGVLVGVGVTVGV